MLLAGFKFMIEMHLRQLVFSYSACGPFIKNKERIEKLKKKTEYWRYIRYICQNKLGKSFFKHDVACGYFKDLKKTTAADKVLRDKTFNIAKNPKCDWY